ncbi:TonB-dependent receptor [Runella zeae]|uniref:TonB-dependent receptor n=1 Tax=Runella zeae TaxID=94255 RepID=UPI00235711E9|nr:TonB-dependent receptor [Runella zeae]
MNLKDLRKMRLIIALFAVVAAICVTLPEVKAQVTTSTLSGTVKDDKNSELPGATVVAVHVPSGTQYGTVTNVSGNYSIPNMRIGGPYKVTVSFVGFGAKTYDDIYLKLGEPYTLNSQLSTGDVQLAEVVVISAQNKLLSSERLGAVTNIGSGQIQALPSISRSINDLTRLTPQANGTSVGGGNYRQNNITIDGADFNNNFGIGTNLPGGNATPISLDAIEEISVNVTPYDIRQSGFIGSAINAVTRSGNNNFSGSAYTYFRNQNQQGNKVGDNTFARQNLDYKQYGFRLGGPLIKNKLFFFVNAETEKQITPGPSQIAATAQLPFSQNNPQVSRPTVDEMNTISGYLRDTYGYETGPYQGYSSNSFSTKFLVRLDWNINKNHRINVRYNQLKSESSRIQPSTSVSPFTNIYPQNRQSTQALQYENSGYFQAANFTSFAAELNSTFGGKFANTLRATYTHQNDPRTTKGGQFPFVDILKDGNPLTSFGTELFSYGNLRDVEMLSFVDNLTWTSGKHNWTVGAQADFNTTKNGFQRFGTGFYVFQSWDDFTSGKLPSHYGLTYSLAPNFEQVFPSFKFSQYSVYGQDEINVNSKLKITAGLRIDLPTYPEPLKEHPLISQLTFANGQKVNTGALPKSSLLWSPRVGFNYDVKGDRSLQVRGGSGIFSGRVPFVWIVSQAGDAGMLQVTQTWTGANVPGPFRLEPYYPTTVPVAGTSIPTGGTTAISPDFKMPQTWKSSLAVDMQLPWGIVGTVEGIYNKDINTAYFSNINLVQPAALGVSGYPDNRLMYPTTNTQKYINPLTSAGQYSPTGTTAYNVTMLGNASQGYYWSLTAKLEKQFSKGISASLAYVRSGAKNLFDGGGDQPASAFQGTATVNGSNFATLSYANYVVPTRLVGSFSYRKEYAKFLATSISLVYQGSADGRFSYIYSTDFNRDGANADLIYIPKDPSEITFVSQTVGSGANAVTYTPQQQSDAFFQYIEQDAYLSKRKGQYAERNGAALPWRNQFDFRILQDFFVNVQGKRNTIQLSVDIFNLGNLLNSSWGLTKLINNNAILIPANNSSVVSGGTVKPTYRLGLDRGGLIKDTFRDNVGFSSTYYMQFGVRYIFN